MGLQFVRNMPALETAVGGAPAEGCVGAGTGAIEATEEAIYDALPQATTMTGYGGATVEALPVDEVMALMEGRPAAR